MSVRWRCELDKSNEYRPKLIGSEIAIPEELFPLIERLAENNHESWAIQRMAEGWTYAPERDSAKKTHDMLVPYDQLPESEREVDRELARSIIRAMLALGVEIRLAD